MVTKQKPSYREWVDLLGSLCKLDGSTHDRLDLVGLDETSKVGKSDGGTGKVVVLLQSGTSSLRAIESLELLEGSLGPDDEAAEVATGSKVEDAEVGDVGKGDTRQVAEGTADTLVLVIDDQGTTALDVATVADLTNTGADVAGVLALEDIIVETELWKFKTKPAHIEEQQPNIET